MYFKLWPHARPRESRAPVSRAELPPEIWTLVLDFLDVVDLQKLRIVDHTLRELALNKLYYELDFFCLGYVKMLRNVQLLRDNPDIASRVRILRLYSRESNDAIKDYGFAPEKAKKRGFRAFIKRSTSVLEPGPTLSVYSSPPLRTHAMLCAAKNLLNVKEISHRFEQFINPCPIFLAVLPMVSQNLETLRLDWNSFIFFTTTNDLDWKMPPSYLSGLEMPRLHSLTIIPPPYLPVFGEVFISFTHCLPVNLESLSINFASDERAEGACLPRNMAKVFERLTELKHLSVALPLCLWDNDRLLDPAPVNELISHRRSLRHLNIVAKPCGERREEISFERVCD
ncbi:hypothetical protein H0H93_010097, partial [Arthromyces matolae]